MTPYSSPHAYEVIWNGALETEWIRSQQRKPTPEILRTLHAPARASKDLSARGAILAYLRRHPGSSAGALIDNLGISKPTVWSALQVMERQGRVRRIAPTPDAYHVAWQAVES